jgi:hypothetical protein
MSTAVELARGATDRQGASALALAWRPADVPAADRMRLPGRLRVGRAPDAGWPIADRRLSSAHFEVLVGGGRAAIRDLDSRNGTFVNGMRLGSPRPLLDQDVIRAGRCIFVYVADASTITLEVGEDRCATCHDPASCQDCHYRSSHPSVPGTGMGHGG